MSVSQIDLTDRLELAVTAAKKAGELTLEYFRRPDLKVDRKGDDSPVTVADREAEILLRDMIQDRFPDDGIFGEEFPERPGSSQYRWILDPIDGTKSFVSGVPLFANLIGLEHGNRSVLGVINVPAADECVFAAMGQGAWHQIGEFTPKRAHVSDGKHLDEGLFVTSEIDCFVERGALDAFLQLERTARVTRTWGDAYGYLLLATGRALVMIDAAVSLWDIAAVQPVVEEAGGTFTDWQGNRTIHAGEAIGTNKAVLEAVLSITRPFLRP
jgi:histidinol phosphatase-like enzyme (inositol monophosphatase family)